VLERERRLQREVVGRLLGPADAIFDLLEQSGAAMRQQAEALEEAGRALEQTAALVKTQAELFERTVRVAREPTELAKAAAGVKPRDRTPALHRMAHTPERGREIYRRGVTTKRKRRDRSARSV